MTKKEPKVYETSKLNIPKILAYIALVICAIIGIKTLLNSRNEAVAYVFSVIITLLIVHTILNE